MRHRLSVVASLTLAALAACAGHDSPTPPPQLGLALAIAAGDSQVAPVTDTLPQPIDVLATLTSTGGVQVRLVGRGELLASTAAPAANTTVSFHVLDAGCGQPYSQDLITDSSGHAKNRWILGTHAGACRMSTGYVDQTTGAIVVVDTATATALAGPLAHAGFSLPRTWILADSVLVLPAVGADAYGNPVAPPAPTALDSLIASGSAGTYAVGGTQLGTYRFLESADTLRLVVFPPTGSFRAVRHWADSSLVETGQLELAAVDSGSYTSCFDSWATPAPHYALYRATNVTAVKTAAGGMADTLRQATWDHAVTFVADDAARTVYYRPVRGQQNARPCLEGRQAVDSSGTWRFVGASQAGDTLTIAR